MAKKVLICDDEPSVQESLSYIVKKEGFDFIIAMDGQTGVETARYEIPDLMFLDVRMPKLSGYEVCGILKNNPDTRNIYIIILTAYGSLDNEKLARKAGADGFMVKPFSPRTLKARLHEILG